ncbi:unnamed protein product [Schistocephalus solidus]|uniref:C2H2-type domain-containing protein n=1 Tax=Schistocephalus solidus TaxID=70667 RepID=A0A183SKK1_SCHSO|nr:unnamed protein product [Schistocephalus solidus]
MRWSGHQVRMDDERLPKRRFYEDVAMGSHRRGLQPPTVISGTNFLTPTTIATTSQYSSPVTSNTTTATNTAAVTTTTSDGGSVLNCPFCDRRFLSRIGLVGYLRIHRMETAEPVRGAPKYSRRTHVQCPYCSRTFTHCMGL